jgi:hypothetical protein
MSIVEPPAALDVLEHEPEVAVEPPVTAPVTELDHVRSHSVKCYWDYRDCRWQCSDD